MNILLKEHQDFLIQLIDAQVDFILIGGYAVIYHGYARTTGDMDIWLRPENDNREKLTKLFKSIGIVQDDLDTLNNSDFALPLAFQINNLPKRIDFLTKIVGLKFEEAIKTESSCL
ncbi:MAG: hypothetical protein RIA63_05065 [Cyclobacteriaceae bacterium]